MNYQVSNTIRMSSKNIGHVLPAYQTQRRIIANVSPRWIAKLVNITPITLVYGTQITIITGANLNQLTSLGGAHTVANVAQWMIYDSPTYKTVVFHSSNQWDVASPATVAFLFGVPRVDTSTIYP